MRLGIIGCGTIVQEFLPKLIKLDGIEVVGIMDAGNIEKTKEFAKENNILLCTNDFEELANSNIDTVYVAVPNFLHYDYCVKAMNKGLNVIVEKPFTSNYKQSKELIDIAKEKNVFLFEAITTLYLGNYLKIKEWLPLIGDIKIVQSQYSQYSRRYDAFKNGEILPVFDINKAGGALMDLGLYNIFYIVGLFNEPEEVYYYPNIERNIDTSGILIMDYKDFKAIALNAKDCKGVAYGMIQGTNGCIKSKISPNMIGKVILELNDGTKEEYDDGYDKERLIPEFNAFINAINNKNYDFCYEMLDKSLIVSKIQTKARMDCGIIFPEDKI